jgi:HK97 family phage major capsid protein
MAGGARRNRLISGANANWKRLAFAPFLFTGENMTNARQKYTKSKADKTLEHIGAMAKAAKGISEYATDILTRTAEMLPDPAQESEAEIYPAESGERDHKSADVLVAFGGAVKATPLDNGNVKLGGYLIRYGDASNPDISTQRDFFTPATDFGDASSSAGWFNHRMPVTYGDKSVSYKTRLPDAALTRDDVGIFAEIILGARDEYERMIAEMGMAGKLGWSSGTAQHLVERREAKNNTHEITSWPLGLDASLTPTPAEPSNSVIPLKSLSAYTASIPITTGNAEAPRVGAQSNGGEDEAKSQPVISSKESTMPEITQEMLQQTAREAAAEAVKAYANSLPAKDSAGVAVILDEADRSFRSLAEMAKAVKVAEMSQGRKMDPRLLRIKAVEEAAIKANGANESVPSDAGFLVEPTIGQEIITPIHETGPFSSRVRRLPVSSNSNFGYINGIDETSRATGSRWGGVRGYRIAEAATITSSRPKFRRVNWELKKFAALMYATDELLMDAAQFNAVANQSAGEEIAFMVNDDIVNGTGTGGPQGVLQSGALVTVSFREDVNKISHADVVSMWQRMLPRNKKNAAWFCNSDVMPALNKLYFTGTTSVLSPYINYSPEGVLMMFGKPVIETEFNPALGTSGGAAGDLLLADFSDYLFWDKGDVQAATSIHIAFLTDEQAFRFVYRCDGQSAWASPITPYKAGATVLTQSAFVVLSAASS